VRVERKEIQTRHGWAIFLIAFPALVTAGVLGFLPRLAQWASYHQFADGRTLFGVPNFMDVVSNAWFVILGVWGGLEGRAASKREGTQWKPETLAYFAFFISLFVTGFGSGWYHLRPDNASLFWDRFPLSLAFVSLFAAVVHERFQVRGGYALLLALLTVAAASVLYWSISESRGAGDLRPYFLVQFLPMVLIPILLFLPSRYDRVGDLGWVLFLYALAKGAELLDRPIFEITYQVSGHTLKHLFSALAVAQVAWMLRRRRLKR